MRYTPKTDNCRVASRGFRLALSLLLLGAFLVASVENPQAGENPRGGWKALTPTPTVVDATGQVVGTVIDLTSLPGAPALYGAQVVAAIGESVTTVLVTPSEITGIPPWWVWAAVAFSDLNCEGTAYVYDFRSGPYATTEGRAFGGIALTDGVNLYIPKPVESVPLSSPPQSRLTDAYPGGCENFTRGDIKLYVEALTVPLSTVNAPFTPPFSIKGLHTLP